jgi:hypothetical protein
VVLRGEACSGRARFEQGYQKFLSLVRGVWRWGTGVRPFAGGELHIEHLDAGAMLPDWRWWFPRGRASYAETAGG